LAWLDDAPVGEVRALQGHSSAVLDLSVSRSGRMLASVDREGTVLVWELARGREVQKITAHGGTRATVAITPDERLVVSNASRDALGVWDAKTGQPAGRITTGRDAVDVTFSRDGRRLAWALPITARAGPNIGLWDWRANRPLAALLSQGTPHAVRLSPDGRLLAAGDFSNDYVVEVWALPNTQAKSRLAGLPYGVVDLAFSPDSRLVAAAASTKVIIWNATSGQQVQSLSVTAPYPSVDFTADGRRVVTSGSAGAGIQIWNVSDGKPLEDPKLAARGGFVHKVLCLPDRRGAVSGYSDGSIRLWRLPD
jgi:WD40 repeat protein